MLKLSPPLALSRAVQCGAAADAGVVAQEVCSGRAHGEGRVCDAESRSGGRRRRRKTRSSCWGAWAARHRAPSPPGVFSPCRLRRGRRDGLPARSACGLVHVRPGSRSACGLVHVRPAAWFTWLSARSAPALRRHGSAVGRFSRRSCRGGGEPEKAGSKLSGGGGGGGSAPDSDGEDGWPSSAGWRLAAGEAGGGVPGPQGPRGR